MFFINSFYANFHLKELTYLSILLWHRETGIQFYLCLFNRIRNKRHYLCDPAPPQQSLESPRIMKQRCTRWRTIEEGLLL